MNYQDTQDRKTYVNNNKKQWVTCLCFEFTVFVIENKKKYHYRKNREC